MLLVIVVVAVDSTVLEVFVVVLAVIGVGDDDNNVGLSFGERFFAWKLRMFRGRNNALRGTMGARCKKSREMKKLK